jgi:hypothetical protein
MIGAGLIPLILEGFTKGTGFTVTDYNNSANKLTARSPQNAQMLSSEMMLTRAAEIDLPGSIICTNYNSFLWRIPGTEKEPLVGEVEKGFYNPKILCADPLFFKPLETMLKYSPTYPDNYDLVILGVDRKALAQVTESQYHSADWEAKDVKVSTEATPEPVLLNDDGEEEDEIDETPFKFMANLASLKRTCKDRKLALEVMETGKAMATFNILVGEGRNIICALVVPAVDDYDK